MGLVLLLPLLKPSLKQPLEWLSCPASSWVDCTDYVMRHITPEPTICTFRYPRCEVHFSSLSLWIFEPLHLAMYPTLKHISYLYDALCSVGMYTVEAVPRLWLVVCKINCPSVFYEVNKNRLIIKLRRSIGSSQLLLGSHANFAMHGLISLVTKLDWSK